jgi:hypothetical protein
MCAAVYAISIYPGLVGAYEFYDFNDFYKDETCKNYFLGGETHASFARRLVEFAGIPMILAFSAPIFVSTQASGRS